MPPLSDTPPTAPRSATLPLLFALLLLALFVDPLFVRRNFSGRDLLVYNLPMEKVVHDAWSRGSLPIWNPSISGGRPLLPNPNSGALYPIRAALGIVPFPVAMRVFPVLHWTIAGVGMILLLLSLNISRAGSWLGGVTYALSGTGMSDVFYPHIHPGMALLPWILWAFIRRTRSPARKLLLLSLLFAGIFLGGDVFTSGMAILSCGLWILRESHRAEKSTDFRLLILAILLAILLALPQIVATALWIPETNRAVLGMKIRDSVFFSIHPLRLLEFVVPFVFGRTWTLDNSDIWGWTIFRGKAMGLFSTLYAGAFAAMAAVTGWRSRRPGARFARSIVLFALAIAVAPSLIPAAWEGIASPLPLRNPEKFAVAFTFGLAILVGLELDRLRLRDFRWPRWILAVAVILCVSAVGAAFFSDAIGRAAAAAIGGTSRMARTAAELLPAAIAEGGLLWVITVVALDLLGRPGKAHLATSLALLTFVPIVANRKIARTFSEEELFSPTLFARYLDRADPAREYRVLGESLYPLRTTRIGYAGWDDEYTDTGRRLWIHQTPALWGRGMVFNVDFDAGDLSRVERLRKLSYMFSRHTNSALLFGSLSLRWGVRFRDQNPPAGFQSFQTDLPQVWDVNREALPHVRLAEAWTEETSALAAVNAIPGLRPREIVVETGTRRRGRSRPGEARVLQNAPELLVVEVVTPDPTWLFVLRGFWRHRSVEIDGRPVEDFPAQVAFSAVPVPAGRHSIEWRELVPGGNVSRWGPVLFVLLSAALVVRERRRKTA